MATHSSILAWKSHEEKSLWAIVHVFTRVGDDLVTKQQMSLIRLHEAMLE